VTVEREFPAPDALAVSTAAVPEGSPAQLNVRLEAVVDGVLVTGTVEVVTAAECSRCLDPVAGELRADIQQLFEYPDQQVPGLDEDDALPVLVGDLIDLEPTVRDAIVLDLPQVPLCTPDCPGLCEQCGARLADDPNHRHTLHDSRWAALEGLLDDAPAAAETKVSPRDAGSMDVEQRGL